MKRLFKSITAVVLMSIFIVSTATAGDNTYTVPEIDIKGMTANEIEGNTLFIKYANTGICLVYIRMPSGNTAVNVSCDDMPPMKKVYVLQVK